MNVSLNWLSDFLRRPLEPRDVAARLGALGAPADAIEPLHADLGGIVVGLVKSAGQHPNADRLRVCVVDDGSGTERHVVCGAPNVAAGGRYPFAPVGATLPGGLRIEKRKLRGEVSEGMLCSARELGLGDDHQGLWALAGDAAPGTPLLAAVPLADTRLVLDVTPNRPDLLGHKGVARELAAALGVQMRLPALPGSPGGTMAAPVRSGASAATGGIRVAIEDPAGCPRFLGAVLRGVQVTASPDWLVRRLEVVGVRSINNVVDATNYVMFELNQPMHAYDLSKLRGGAVIARRARAGERLRTLDDVDRVLDDRMTVIADADGVIGVAGVMGGAGSEVSAETRDVFLECAFFEPSGVRRARRALNLSTEASFRFERGVDRWNGAEALRRCVELMQLIAGGELAPDAVDLCPAVTHPPRIFLRPSRVAQVLGTTLSWQEIERALVAIGATVVSKPDDGRIAVDVPGWRPDLLAEIDLIEEVARVHGYDAVPEELRAARPGRQGDDPAFEAAARLRGALIAEGLFEVVTLPMTAVGGPGSVRLLNPLSATEGHLRAALLPGLTRLAELNWAAQLRDIRLFEVATVFAPAPAGEPPREELHVAAIVTGARAPQHWTLRGREDCDVWDAKGLFERVAALAAPGSSIQPGDGGLEALLNGTIVGRARTLAADSPPWAASLFGVELAVSTAPPSPVRFRPMPATPSSGRDLTLLVPDALPVARVTAQLASAGEPLLESVAVVGEYRAADLPSGRRSVTFHLTFRATDRTLETPEVDRAEARLLGVLDRELGVHRRDQGAPAPE